MLCISTNIFTFRTDFCNYETIIIKHGKKTLTICKMLSLVEKNDMELVSLNVRQGSDENYLITILEIKSINSRANPFFTELTTLDGILDITNVEKI